MLTDERIIANKDTFIKLLQSLTDRPGVSNLLDFLNNSDFFMAPASLRLYKNYAGGLCEHALERYHYLNLLVDTKGWSVIPKDSVIICSLLADLNKINYFKLVSSRKKILNPETGDEEWTTVQDYKVIEPEDRFIFGTSGQNAERIITNYMPLKDEESAAIINMGINYENPTFNPSYIYKKYPLVCLLNVADQLATFTSDLEGYPF